MQKYGYISGMEHKARLEQLELLCVEMIRRLDLYEAKLRTTEAQLSLMEARLAKIVDLVGISQEMLDHKDNFWDYPTILRWQLENRNN